MCPWQPSSAAEAVELFTTARLPLLSGVAPPSDGVVAARGPEQK